MVQTKTDKPLPNSLPGAVVAQYRERGDKRYGPYYFRVWREGGRLRKVYVKQTDVEAVRAACQRHRDEQRERRENRIELRDLLRRYKATCREVERWMSIVRLFP